MTQHINLLTRHRARKSMAWLATRGLTGLMVVFVGLSVYTEVSLQRLNTVHSEEQQEMFALRAELQKKRRDAGIEDAQVLAKESAAMRSTMDEHRDLMQVVQKGEVGGLQGHSGFLEVLALIQQPGVWLQGVDVSKAGQAMSISGAAITTAAVIQYAEQLSQAFKAMGVEFSSLEISKDDASGAAALPKGSPIKFKLY